MSSILNGGGVRASAAARSPPAMTFRPIKIGHGGGADQSESSASSLCGCMFDTPINTATPTTAAPKSLLNPILSSFRCANLVERGEETEDCWILQPRVEFA